MYQLKVQSAKEGLNFAAALGLTAITQEGRGMAYRDPLGGSALWAFKSTGCPRLDILSYGTIKIRVYWPDPDAPDPCWSVSFYAGADHKASVLCTISDMPAIVQNRGDINAPDINRAVARFGAVEVEAAIPARFDVSITVETLWQEVCKKVRRRIEDRLRKDRPALLRALAVV